MQNPMDSLRVALPRKAGVTALLNQGLGFLPYPELTLLLVFLRIQLAIKVAHFGKLQRR